MNEKKFTILRRASLYMSAIAMAFVMLVVLPSLSWYEPGTASPIDIEGNVHGSYFESGTGSYEDPFEIARPIQLYYLSWLQEMGYFNERNEAGTGLKQQYHFYLSNDLDMDVTEGGVSFTYNLPPIGTTDYPFVGSFDGKGHYIKNLVITNKETEYSNDPYHHKDGDPTGDAYEILGMFGVLGSTDGTNTVNSSKQVEGSLVPNDSQVTFDQSKNYVKNFYLDTVTINATTTTTDRDGALVGVVAGYANAPISGVGIKGATFSIGDNRTPINDLAGTTDNAVLSKYTTVGFATDGNHRNFEYVDEDVFAPIATHQKIQNRSAGDDWGGSIGFESILNRIKKSSNFNGSRTNSIDPYINNENIVKDSNGNILSRETVSTSTQCVNYSNSNPIHFYKNDAIGSYYYKHMDDGKGPKVYLEGYSDIATVKNEHTITLSSQTEETYVFSDVNGYISLNNSGQLTHTSSKANAINWHFDAQNNDLYYLVTINSTCQFVHLNCNANGAFSVGNSSNTNWIKSGTNFIYDVGSPSGTAINLNVSNATLTEGELDSNKLKGTYTWNVNNSQIPEGIYRIQARLKLTSSGHGSITLADGDNSTVPVYQIEINGTRFRPEDMTTSRTNLGIGTSNFTPVTYLSAGQIPSNLSSIGFAYTGNGYSMYFDGLILTPYVPKSVSSETTVDSKYDIQDRTVRSGQPGYVPLSVNGADSYFAGSEAIDINKFIPSNANTGYIIGGYYDKYNGKENTTTIDQTYTGDVRIAAYSIKDDIKSSYGQGSFTKIKTFDSNGVKTIDCTKQSDISKYKKLNESLPKLRNMLCNTDNNGNFVSDKSNIYGIHFMSSAISKDHLITAPQATVNGVTCQNYEFPEDCIDFTLKSKGYINFFAGDYQSDNNAFFTLHEIKRTTASNNSFSTIDEIKEIQYIYGPENGSTSLEYIYQYKGSNSDYSVDSSKLSNITSNGFTYNIDGQNSVKYSKIFDTQWIGVNGSVSKGQSNLWYFEIPVNGGEYALGSVNPGCGGYLVYLDISAAAQTVDRKELNEYFVKETLGGDIANGIQYIDEINDPIDVSKFTKYKNKGTDEKPNYVADDNGDYYLDTNTGQYIKISMCNVRDSVFDIDDLDSFVGTIGTSANGTYEISRSSNPDNISITDGTTQNQIHTNGITLGYVPDTLKYNNESIDLTKLTKIRKITDFDHNSLTNLYAKQVTVIETIGNTSKATTTIYLSDNEEYLSLTQIATFSYSWNSSVPIFAYKYFLNTVGTAGENSLEVSFDTTTAINIKLEYLNSNYKFKVKNTSASIDGSNFDVNSQETLTAPVVANYDITPDVWASFENKTPIQSFHYLTQYDETIEDNFTYTYTSIANAEALTETPTNVNINGGNYEYNFIISNVISSETDIYIYNAAGNVVLHYVKDNNGNWVKAAQ